MAMRIALTLCFLALLALLSLAPGDGRPARPAWSSLVAHTPKALQKTLHVVLYAVLVLLAAWTLADVAPPGMRLALAFGLALGYGAVMEWCQTKVAGRYGTARDVGLNAFGALLGVLAADAML